MHLGDTAHLAVRSANCSTALASIAAAFSAVNTSSGYIFDNFQGLFLAFFKLSSVGCRAKLAVVSAA